MDAELVLEKFEAVLLELNRLKTQTGAPELDEMDLELYGDALKPLRTIPQIDLVRREIRRSCKFCPTAAEVSEMVKQLGGTDTIPAHYADTRKIIARCNADASQRLIEGITPAQMAANRERARAMIASLCAKKPVKRTGKLGEVPEHLRDEFEVLAEKRAEIEQKFGLAGGGK